VSLNDFAGRTVAVDTLTGTTTEELWSPSMAPAATRTVSGVEDWLTVIAAGQAVGISAEATAAQHPRPGVVYRRVRDAPPVPVWLAWWADSPPRNLDALVQLVCEQYGRRTPEVP
jgi:DNA-binding transcriptional LysR family regulator